jgi:hypothetical protein
MSILIRPVSDPKPFRRECDAAHTAAVFRFSAIYSAFQSLPNRQRECLPSIAHSFSAIPLRHI